MPFAKKTGFWMNFFSFLLAAKVSAKQLPTHVTVHLANDLTLCCLTLVLFVGAFS